MSEQERAGTIVVGIDGSDPSRRALEWALRQARLQGAAILAVQAWELPDIYGTGAMVMPGEQFSESAQEALNATVGAVAAEWPDVPIAREAVQGHPAKVLLDKAKGAELLVVGSRGHGGFIGALIGSVSHRVIQHASCPVVVIHG
ncbi:universal stress protein [Glycomyces sp. NRRL B-16210]|uniref:universal stress protein n=1 Tax=Glycomyces sp. NRRL B-16210 TaxID=1463821 RepID=UPI0004C2A73F|nr:universal stress protein [Glycomyces sp. NRRL B-16210]